MCSPSCGAVRLSKAMMIALSAAGNHIRGQAARGAHRGFEHKIRIVIPRQDSYLETRRDDGHRV
jgi:hypothetical protein